MHSRSRTQAHALANGRSLAVYHSRTHIHSLPPTHDRRAATNTHTHLASRTPLNLSFDSHLNNGCAGKAAHNLLDILQERFRPGSSHPGAHRSASAHSTASQIALSNAMNKERKVFSLLPYTQVKLEPRKKYSVVLVHCESPGKYRWDRW